jgi:integrase
VAQKFTFKGSLFQKKGRWYWKVKLPNESQRRNITLAKSGQAATYNEATAKELAQRIWGDAVRISNGQAPEIRYVGDLKTAYLKALEQRFPPASDAPEKARYAIQLIDCDELLVDDFGPLKLRQARSKLIGTEKILSVKTINERISTIRRMFEWGAGHEYVRPETAYALKMVENVNGHTVGVKPSKPRDTVSIDKVRATLPHLSSILQSAVKVQLYAGMRPNEVLSMRMCDIDRMGDVWIYKPAAHKNTWRGAEYDRVIGLGKKAQEILILLMAGRCQDEYIFNPQDAVTEIRAKRSKDRKTPLHYGNRPGSNRKGTQVIGERYTKDSYRVAIERACSRAFPLPEHLSPRPGESKIAWGKRLNPDERKQIKKWCKDHNWTPYQLRHTAATIVRAGCGDKGLSVVQAFLGQRSFDVAEMYAKVNTTLMHEAINIVNSVDL